MDEAKIDRFRLYPWVDHRVWDLSSVTQVIDEDFQSEFVLLCIRLGTWISELKFRTKVQN